MKLSVSPEGGVCFGILGDVREDHPRWRYGWQTTRFIDLLERLGPSAYVFSPEEVSEDRGEVWGYVWEEGWRGGEFPLPGVIYDRYLPPPGRVRTATDSLCERLAVSGCLFVNSPKMARLTRNKWETAQAFLDHPTLGRFFPRVRRMGWDPETQRFLEEQRGSRAGVFIKPTEGARGMGVLRFEPEAVDFLVQEGLEPLTYQGRVLDLRILMQRDGRGEWVIPPWIGRVGPWGEHRANLAVGGEAWPGHLILELALASRPSLLGQVEQQMGTFLETLPAALEELAGPCGEMGVDFLIDQQGQVWCLEINPKPGFEGLRAIGDLLGRDLRGEALTRMADQMRWRYQSAPESFANP